MLKNSRTAECRVCGLEWGDETQLVASFRENLMADREYYVP